MSPQVSREGGRREALVDTGSLGLHLLGEEPSPLAGLGQACHGSPAERGWSRVDPAWSIFCGDTWISVPMRGDGYCKATLFLVLLLAGEWECNTILATLMSPCPLHPTFILEQLFPHITRSLQKGLFALESAKNELVLQSRVRCGQCWEGLRLCPHHHHQLQKEGFPYMWQDRG